MAFLEPNTAPAGPVDLTRLSDDELDALAQQGSVDRRTLAEEVERRRQDMPDVLGLDRLMQPRPSPAAAAPPTPTPLPSPQAQPPGGALQQVQAQQPAPTAQGAPAAEQQERVTVRLPDGRRARFPAGMSPEQMRAAIVSNFPEFAPQRSWLGHAGEIALGTGRGLVQMGGQTLQGVGTIRSMAPAGAQNEVRAALDAVAASEDPDERARQAEALRLLARNRFGGEDARSLFALAGRLQQGEDVEALRAELGELEGMQPPMPPGERATTQLGERVSQWAEETMGPKYGYEGSLSGEFGGALGSLAGFGLLSATLGPLASFSTAGVLGIQEQFERAKASGLGDDEALQYAARGAPAGVIQALSVEFILRKVPPNVRSPLLRRTRDLAEAFGAEFAVENLGAVMQNAIEQEYNPERDLFEGTPYQGILSGSAAATLRAILLTAMPGRYGPPGPRATTPQQQAAEEQQQPVVPGTETAAEAAAPAAFAPGQPVELGRVDPASGQIVFTGEPAQVVGITPDGQGVIVQHPDGRQDTIGRRLVRPAAAPAQEATAAAPPAPGVPVAEQQPPGAIPAAPGAPEAAAPLSSPAVEATPPAEGLEPFLDDFGQQIGWLDPITGDVIDLETGAAQAAPAEAPMAPEAAQTAPGEAGAPVGPPGPADPQIALQPLLRQLPEGYGAEIVPDDGSVIIRAPDGEVVEQGQRLSPSDIEVYVETAQQHARQVRQAEARQDLEQVLEAPAERSLEQIRAEQRPEIPTRIARQDVAIRPDGQEVAVDYALVEAADLVPSHDATGRINPAFPQGFQPRDRTRAASQQQIAELAQRLDPRLLGESPSVTDGAPIIGPEGIVESGNARSIAIRAAYQQGLEAATRYRDWLAQQGYDVSGMTEPVLVRVRRTPYDTAERAEFTRVANERTTMGLSATERAMADAAAMTPDLLALYRGGDVLDAGNRAFARGFIEQVATPADRASLMDAQGRLSAEGTRRLHGALTAAAYGDAAMVALMVEATDSNIKAIGDALQMVAPHWAIMRNEAARGEIDAAMDQTDALLEAVRLVRRARSEGRNVQEYLPQQDMFAGEAISPMGRGFLEIFFHDDALGRPVRDKGVIARPLERYVDQARKTQPGPSLFGGDARVAPADVLETVRRAGRVPEQQQLLPEGAPGARGRGGRGRAREGAVEPPAPAQPQGAPAERGPADRAPLDDDVSDIGTGGAVADGLTFPDDAHRRLYEYGKHLAEGGAPIATEQQAITDRMAGFVEDLEATGESADTLAMEFYEGLAGPNRPSGGYVGSVIDPGEAARYAVRYRDYNPLFAVSAYPRVAPTEALSANIDAVVRSLREAASRQLPRNVRLRVARRLKEIVAGEEVFVRGWYLNKLVAVALEQDGSPSWTLNHETVHALRDLDLFTEAEWAAMADVAVADQELMQRVQGQYARLNLTREELVEEAVGTDYANWAEARRDMTQLRRIAERIAAFIRALADALRGAGMTRREDVFRAIESGEIAKRPQNLAREIMRADPAYALPENDAPNAESATGTTANIVAEDIAQGGERGREGALRSAFDQLRQIRQDRADMPEPVRDIGRIAYWVNHPSTIATIYPEFTPVFENRVQKFEQRDRIVNELAAIAGPYLVADRTEQNTVNRLLELGRLTKQGWLNHPDGQPLTVTAPQDYQGVLMQPGESVTFTPEQVEMYKGYRRAMNRALELYRLQILRAFGLGQPGQPVTAAGVRTMARNQTNDAARSRLESLAQRLEDLERQKRTGYVPFTRYGDVALAVMVPNPQGGKPIQVAYERVEVGMGSRPSKLGRAAGRALRSQRVGAARRRLQQQHPDAEIRVYNYTPEADAEIDVRLSDLDQLATMAGTNEQAYAAVRESLAQMLQTTGVRAHFLESQDLPGYSTDFARSLSGYVNGMANFIATQNHREGLESAIASINARDQRLLHRYAKEYGDYTDQPTEEFQRLRGFTFFMYLAGNISSAFVNLTQIWTVSWPWLTQFAPMNVTGNALTRAYADATQMMTWERGSLLPTVDFDKAPADVRDALKRAYADGLLVASVTNEMVALSHADRLSLGQTHDRIRSIGQGAFDKAIAVYSAAERANRIVAFIAAYRLAQRKGFMDKAKTVLRRDALWQSRAAVDAAPETFARYHVDVTQFRLGKANRLKLARGPGASVFQFTSFYLNALDLMYKLANQAKDPEARNRSMFALGMMWAMLWVFAGWQGLPFAEDLKDVYERMQKWLTGKDVDVVQSIHDAFQEQGAPFWLSEALQHGPVRQLGIDISMRVGMGRSPARPFVELATGGETQGIRDFGAVFDLFWGRLSRASELIHQERWAAAAAEALPQFLKNPAQAALWGQEGVQTLRGMPAIPAETITPWDQAIKSLGFNPTRIARERDFIYRSIRRERSIEDYRRHVYTRLADSFWAEEQARAAGDAAARDRARARQERIMLEVAAHNQRSSPDQMILLNQPATRTAIRRRIQQHALGAQARRTRSQVRPWIEEQRQWRFPEEAEQ